MLEFSMEAFRRFVRTRTSGHERTFVGRVVWTFRKRPCSASGHSIAVNWRRIIDQSYIAWSKASPGSVTRVSSSPSYPSVSELVSDAVGGLGAGLDGEMRNFIDSRFGYDFSALPELL
jgi:hypothetical protein